MNTLAILQQIIVTHYKVVVLADQLTCVEDEE
jgi:hypothetical protein